MFLAFGVLDMYLSNQKLGAFFEQQFPLEFNTCSITASMRVVVVCCSHATFILHSMAHPICRVSMLNTRSIRFF